MHILCSRWKALGSVEFRAYECTLCLEVPESNVHRVNDTIWPLRTHSFIQHLIWEIVTIPTYIVQLVPTHKVYMQYATPTPNPCTALSLNPSPTIHRS